MKVYEIPQDHLEKLKNWKLRENIFYKIAYKLVQDLTGIKPSEVKSNGEFAFKLKHEIHKKDLPSFLRLDNTGYIVPRRSHKKGKEIFNKWNDAGVPDISQNGFYRYMFGITSLFEDIIRFDTIGDKLYVVHCEWIDLSKYGYVEKEIKSIICQ